MNQRERDAAQAKAAEPPALMPLGYRLPALDLSPILFEEQLMSWKGPEGSTAHSKFLLEPLSHLLPSASLGLVTIHCQSARMGKKNCGGCGIALIYRKAEVIPIWA